MLLEHLEACGAFVSFHLNSAEFTLQILGKGSKLLAFQDITNDAKVFDRAKNYFTLQHNVCYLGDVLICMVDVFCLAILRTLIPTKTIQENWEMRFHEAISMD